MKKLTFIFALFFFSSTLIYAQVLVGGSINFSTGKSSIERPGNSVTNEKNRTFGFQPEIGYYKNEDLLLGVDLSLTFNKRVNPSLDPEQVTKSTGIGVSPFARYYAVRFGKFAVYGQGYLGMYFVSGKEGGPGITDSDLKSSTFMLGIDPGISYDLTSHLELNATLDGIYFLTSKSVTSETVAGTEVKEVTNLSGFSGNFDDIASLSGINIGIAYKF